MRGSRAFFAPLSMLVAFAAQAQSSPPPETFLRPEQGHCIACHQLPEALGQATRADVGPKLEGTRMRSLGKEKLKALIADPVAANAQTVMPPFGRHRILDDAQIAGLVEFLLALP